MQEEEEEDEEEEEEEEKEGDTGEGGEGGRGGKGDTREGGEGAGGGSRESYKDRLPVDTAAKLPYSQHSSSSSILSTKSMDRYEAPPDTSKLPTSMAPISYTGGVSNSYTRTSSLAPSLLPLRLTPR